MEREEASKGWTESYEDFKEILQTSKANIAEKIVKLRFVHPILANILRNIKIIF